MESRRKEPRYAVSEAAVLTVCSDVGGGIYAVTVLDKSNSGMRISIPVAVSVGTAVEIRRSDGVIRAAVRYCRDVGQGYNLGVEVTDVPIDRRREPRYRVEQEATLAKLAGDMTTRHRVMVVDVSRSGFCVEMKSPLIVGVEVELLLNLVVLFGKVRHCRAVGGGRFRIGVWVEEMVVAPRSHFCSSIEAVQQGGHIRVGAA